MEYFIATLILATVTVCCLLTAAVWLWTLPGKAAKNTPVWDNDREKRIMNYQRAEVPLLIIAAVAALLAVGCYCQYLYADEGIHTQAVMELRREARGNDRRQRIDREKEEIRAKDSLYRAMVLEEQVVPADSTDTKTY